MKTLKRILIAIVGIFLFLCIVVAVVWNRELATMNTIKQVDDEGYLYYMENKVLYDLDDLAAADVDQNAELVQYVVGKLTKNLPIMKSPIGCTTFQAKNANGDGYLFGRNYDFAKNPIIVVRNNPKEGYKSLTACDMAHLGYSLEKLPNNLKGKIMCLAFVYAPMDGINEKGLCTSIMALPKMPANQDFGKHDIGTSIVMRLILDRCATVDEAVDLLSNYDIRHDQKANCGYHYMIADAAGNAAVLEFDKEDGWKSVIIRKPEDRNYLVSTNHLLSPKYFTTVPDPSVGNVNSQSWMRYEKVNAFLEAHNGTITPKEASECLESVHWDELVWPDGTVETTQYSVVYNQTALTMKLRPWEEYDRTFDFSL